MRKAKTLTKESENQRIEAPHDGPMVQSMVYIEMGRERNNLSSYSSNSGGIRN